MSPEDFSQPPPFVVATSEWAATMDGLQTIRDLHHPPCIVCSSSHEVGLGLQCHVANRDDVVATFDCRKLLQGYPDMLHGAAFECQSEWRKKIICGGPVLLAGLSLVAL